MVRGEEATQYMESIGFSHYSPQELKRMSVKRITSPRLLDGLGKPVPNGLYDPALGPTEQSDICPTCSEMQVSCPGHFGHIELVMPTYNPILYKSMLRILKNTCLFCHHFMHERRKIEDAVEAVKGIMSDTVIERTPAGERMTMTSGQFIETKHAVDEFLKSPPHLCKTCDAHVPNIRSEGHGRIFLQPLAARYQNSNFVGGHMYTKDSKESSIPVVEAPAPRKGNKKDNKKPKSLTIQSMEMNTEPRILLPSEVKKHLSLLWENEEEICSLFWGGHKLFKSFVKSRNKSKSSVFFLDVLAVTPNRFRPPNYVNNQLLEHPQNKLYETVIVKNIELSTHIAENPGKTDVALRLWIELQNAVNELMDSTTAAGKDRNIGIRQLLEKKTGLFRWHMMGKRVNFTCRSVISPDPFIAVNEIGIPPTFAKKLTYPERVTPWNVERLRKNVENGPFMHPGATHVEDEHGNRINLEYKKQQQRVAVGKTLLSKPSAAGENEDSKLIGKIVHRHLQDGDIVLTNRQPTLHKPGVMAHKARVIPEQRALRLHYANCSTFNADFDGDEMNVHLPQDELGRSEAYEILNANQQYNVPTSGEPIRGLIQDHIISATLLTKKDTFFTREDYQQLVYSACASTPSSEERSFKGKVMVVDAPPIETVPPAILKPYPLWTGKQILTTILNHVTKGRPPFTFQKSAKVSGDYIGKNSEELTVLVLENELLCGIIDKAQFGKFGMVHAIQELYGGEDAGYLLSVFSRLFSSYLFMHGFTCGIGDMLLLPEAEEERNEKLKSAENELGDVVHGRFAGFDEKELSTVGIEKIKDLVGKLLQLRGEAGRARLDMLMSSAMNGVTSAVNNALFPNGLLKRFLVNCLMLMTATGAKGGVVNATQMSSMLGQQELEGKRVPRMSSGKTLPCFQPYEPQARAGGFIKDRFLTGLRPQEYFFHCMAGRDGLVDTAVKTAKSGYLQRCIIKNLECVKVNYDYTVRDGDGSVIQFMYGEDGVDVTKSSCLHNYELLATNRALVTQKLGLKESELSEIGASISKDAYINDMPEGMYQQFEKFCNSLSKESKKPMKLHRRKYVKEFREILKHKYLASLAAPGEPVGVLAGQSIGEPSTQMTLNTFHFAGRGEMNVTLGIPRLHEILTVASKSIRTPIMTCPLKPGLTRDDGETLAGVLSKVSLGDILEAVEVSAIPFHVENGVACRLYKVKLRIYPAERFPPNLNITGAEIDYAVKFVFSKSVRREIEKEIKTLTSAKDTIAILGIAEDVPAELDEEQQESKKKRSKVEFGEEAEDESDEENEEEGTDAQKRKGRSTDDAAYETDSENEDENGEDMEIDDDDEKTQNADGEVINDEEADEKDSKKSARIKARGRTYEMKFSASQNSPHLFLPHIVERVLKGITVRRTKKIEKCAAIDLNGNPDTPAVQTEGVNFEGLWQLASKLSINKLVSNDIAAVLHTYGVEAARATIVREVQTVFGSYGISVNVRHLGLIADFMTNQGDYRPLNRIGIVANPSPFLKMSFETASQFLIDASLREQVDQLNTPSSRIIVGRPVDLGTGCFDILQTVEEDVFDIKEPLL